MVNRGTRGLQGMLLATLFCVGMAGAAQAAEAGWSHALAHELMSPYCPGRALPDCPSSQATELRTWIVAQEAAGRTQEEVMAQLLARFGDEVLQKPRADGFGMAAYLIPVVAVAVGATVLLRFLRRQRAGATATPSAPRLAPVDPELERVVEQEFKRARERA